MDVPSFMDSYPWPGKQGRRWGHDPHGVAIFMGHRIYIPFFSRCAVSYVGYADIYSFDNVGYEEFV